MKIKTIDVQVKEWFDRVNGNSYFGGQIVINYAMKDEQQISIPFQYGYGDQYRYEAFKILRENGFFPDANDKDVYWRYYTNNNIIARHVKYEKCLKKEVINYSQF